MGYRVHVVSRVEKFGDTEAFNWKNREFVEILDCLGCDTWSNDECDQIECEKALFKDAILIAKNIGKLAECGTIGKLKETLVEIGVSQDRVDGDDFEELDPEVAEDIELTIENDLGYTVEDFAKVLQSFLDESDPDNDHIYFRVW